jgi:hypothetical protein
MNRPITERRQLLRDHMVEVGNHIKFSEMKTVTKKSQLSEMIKDVLQQGLEGRSHDSLQKCQMVARWYIFKPKSRFE